VEGIALARKLGLDPVIFFASIAVKGELPNADGTVTKVGVAERLDAAKAVLPYLMPRLSATQLSGRDQGPVAVATFDVTRLLSDPALAAKAEEVGMALLADPSQQ